MTNKKRLKELKAEVKRIEQRLKIAELQLEINRKIQNKQNTTTNPWSYEIKWDAKDSITSAQQLMDTLDRTYQRMNRKDTDVDL